MVDNHLDDYGDDDTLEFDKAETPEQFRAKATELMSNMMDFLNQKTKQGMLESSDCKTITEIAKIYRVGIASVGELAEAARTKFEAEIAAEFIDTDTGDDSFRFHKGDT